MGTDGVQICKIFGYAKFQYVHTLIDIHTEIVLLYMWTGIKEIKMDLLYKYTERYSALFIISSHCFFYIYTYIFIDVFFTQRKFLVLSV